METSSHYFYFFSLFFYFSFLFPFSVGQIKIHSLQMKLYWSAGPLQRKNYNERYIGNKMLRTEAFRNGRVNLVLSLLLLMLLFYEWKLLFMLLVLLLWRFLLLI
jgi:hypothetical protein